MMVRIIFPSIPSPCLRPWPRSGTFCCMQAGINSQAAQSDRPATLVFTAALFVSAALVFAVQPMLARMALPLLALSAAAGALMLPAHAGYVVPLRASPMSWRLANMLVAYTAYLGMMVWPTGLAVLYPCPLG